MVRTHHSRWNRALIALLVGAAAAVLVAQNAFAAVSWGSVREVAHEFTYNTEQSLARTQTSSTSHLHAVFGATMIKGVLVTDSGPYAGAYYSRGNAKGTNWGNKKRLNPKTKHATSPAIVASGNVLYAAYVTLGRWFGYDPAEPRPITLRINSNHGGKAAWLDRKITPAATRVDRPTLAAWDTRGVVAVFTNADTGEIVLLQCGDLTVSESGCTESVIATTNRIAALDPDDGFEGLPVVATSGDDIAVAWLDEDAGGISYIVKDGEADWTAPVELTAAVADGLSIAARGTRIGFSWAEDTGIKVRLDLDGTLGPTRNIMTSSPTGTYRQAYSTAIALASTSTVGVAFAACRRTDCNANANTGVDLRWRESSNNGSTWASPATVAIYSAKSARRINDFPSVVMSSTTKRFILFNAASASFSTYRVYLRVGSG